MYNNIQNKIIAVGIVYSYFDNLSQKRQTADTYVCARSSAKLHVEKQLRIRKFINYIS